MFLVYTSIRIAWLPRLFGAYMYHVYSACFTISCALCCSKKGLFKVKSTQDKKVRVGNENLVDVAFQGDIAG